MPTDAAGIDDVDLARPSIGRRWLQFGHKSIGQRPRADIPPIALEVIDFESDHLVALPLGHIDVLQDEICTTEAKTGQTRSLPHLREAQFLKKRERRWELWSGRTQRVKSRSSWHHRSSWAPETDGTSIVSKPAR